jgi:hypothetical protein
MTASKTVLTDGTKVYWEEGDCISVCGAQAPFTTDLKGTAAKAVFKGEVAVSENYYAAYPVSAVKEWSDDFLVMNLPRNQQAVKGTFASGLNLTVASATDTARHFQFHNVVGYAKFTVGEASGKITSVVIRTKGGEPVS